MEHLQGTSLWNRGTEEAGGQGGGIKELVLVGYAELSRQLGGAQSTPMGAALG